MSDGDENDRQLESADDVWTDSRRSSAPIMGKLAVGDKPSKPLRITKVGFEPTTRPRISHFAPPQNFSPRKVERNEIVEEESDDPPPPPPGGEDNQDEDGDQIPPPPPHLSWSRKMMLEKEAEERFLGAAFAGIDGVIHAFMRNDFIDGHPLAELLYEATLSVREVLNCWLDRCLHSAAVESLTLRNKRVAEYIVAAAGPPVSKIHGRLERMSALGWITRDFNVQLDILTSAQDNKQFDLSTVQGVEDMHTGHSSEFKVQFANSNDVLHLKAENDAVKQAWLTLFKLYGHQNYLRYSLSEMRTNDRLRIFYNCIFQPYQRTATGKNVEFMFATPTTDRELDWQWDIEEEDDMVMPQSGFLERFKVGRIQPLGKPRRDEMEVDLANPHRLLIYKLRNNIVDEYPYRVFQRHDLVDFRVDPSKGEMEITAHFRKKDGKEQEFHHKFIFEDVSSLNRFRELMRLFQHDFSHDLFTLVYQDILHVIVRADAPSRRREITEASRSRDPVSGDMHPPPEEGAPEEEEDPVSGGVFKGQLHALFSDMREMDSGHSVELFRASSSLPFNAPGDLQRIRLLVHKLYARSPDELLCHCTIPASAPSSPYPSSSPTSQAFAAAAAAAASSSVNLETENAQNKECYLLTYRSLIQAQGIHDLARFVREARDPELKAWALRGVWGILHVSQLVHKCRGTLKGVTGSTETQARAKAWEVRPSDFSQYVWLAMQKRELQEQCINVLFEILLAYHHLSMGESEIPRLSVFSKVVARREILPVLLHALRRTTPVARELALQNLILLTHHEHPQNSLAFFSSSNWQSWIMPLLCMHYKEHCTAQEGSQLYKLSLALLTNLHYAIISSSFPLFADMQGQDIKTHVFMSSLYKLIKIAGWKNHVVHMASQILTAIVTKLQSNVKLMTNNLDIEENKGRAYERIYSVMNVLVEFVFFMPCHAFEPSPAPQPSSVASMTANATVANGMVGSGNGGNSGPVSASGGVVSGNVVDPAAPNAGPRRKDKAQGPQSSLHLDKQTGTYVDKKLVSQAVELLDSLKLARQQTTYHSLGSKKNTLHEKIIKEGLQWYDFFLFVRHSLSQLETMRRDHEENLRNLAGNGWSMDELQLTDMLPILTRLSQKLFEQQRWRKSSRKEEECDLTSISFSASLFQPQTIPKKRSRITFQRQDVYEL